MPHISRKAGGRAVAGLFLIILLVSSGCGLRQPDILSLAPDNSPEVYLAEVPFFKQETFQCGPASLAMVLAWSGLVLKPDDLVDDVYTARLHGSLQPALISTARQYGRVAYPIRGLNELFAEINAGHPVIVLQNLGLNRYPRWHYAVAVGYENSGGTVILQSGTTEAEALSLRVFQNTWSRSDFWGLVVLPPDILPATASEEKYLNAVAGLERAGRFEAAIRGYRAAIGRWPESLAARMGLGNSFYAQGNLSAAADAFESAVQLYPADGMPLNNLSQVLWELGKRQRALSAIQRAIELGGPYKHLFEQTLQGFQQGMK